MILIIYCDNCNKELGRSDMTDSHAFMSLMTLLHAGGDHAGFHKLRPQLLVDLTQPDTFKDITFQSSSKHEISIKCNHSQCDKGIIYKDVPLILCPAMILAYHSGHEGHPLTVLIDGNNFAAS